MSAPRDSQAQPEGVGAPLEFPIGRGSYWKYRLLILPFGLILAVLLALRGQLVLGVVIAGLALLRIAFFGLFARRRRSAYGIAARPVPELLRSFVRGDLEAAATALGMQAAELRRQFEAGHSIADSAEATGVPVDGVIDAVIRYASGRIDQLASEGGVSDELAAQAKQRLPIWAARFVERRDPRARAGIETS